MQDWAQVIANQRQHFDTLYIFFKNTINMHAYYNIAMLREALGKLGLRCCRLNLLEHNLSFKVA
jgi:uncharacterized protein YecE (DUF72 family)